MSEDSSQSWPDIAGRLVGEAGQKAHVLPIRVYYEDTDFSGVIYHAGYLRFCERGRSDFLRLIGVNHSELFDGGEQAEALAFAVTRLEADFHAAGRIDDLVEVQTRFTALTAARITIDQRIMRENTKLFSAKVTVVLLGNGGRPKRISRALADQIGAYMSPSDQA